MDGGKAVKSGLACIVAATLAGCSAQDSDYIPYTLSGMQAVVYLQRSGQTRIGPPISGNYFSRDSMLAACQASASDLAPTTGEPWSYVCCTMTSSSSCVTKVR